MKFILFSAVFFTALSALGAPECLIDRSENRGLLGLVSGEAKGFATNGPIYVTVTNDNKKYTTMANKDGFWAVLIANSAPSTDVLCWQPWRDTKAVGVTRN